MSALALEHLQDFVAYTYTFYTGILKEQMLHPFRSSWGFCVLPYGHRHHGHGLPKAPALRSSG